MTDTQIVMRAAGLREAAFGTRNQMLSDAGAAIFHSA